MKKKSSFNYDLGFFFLVAVIAVSLSAFVREMNVVLSGINADNQAAQVLISNTSTANTIRYTDDVRAFADCSNKSVRENLACVKADFNGDGYVNFADLAILKASLKYDLNGDGMLTFTDDMSDLVMLKDCFLDSVSSKPECIRADLDKDGYINFSDLQRLKSAFTYDLNNDKRVGGAATDADLAVFKTCFGLTASSSPVCASADFNKDRIVNFSDLQLFQSATTNVDYDIDRNGVVEATPRGSDLAYFKTCIFENPNTEANCKKADFNNDNFVNFTDLALLRSATLYDLNGDGKVSYGLTSNATEKITVLYPNGGEVLYKDGTGGRNFHVTLSWQSVNPNKIPVNIDLINKTNSAVVKRIANNVADVGSYVWNTGSDVSTGEYRILVSLNQDTSSVGDVSNGSFNLVPFDSNNTSSVSVISPNGGETLVQGSYYPILFRSNTDITSVWLMKDGVKIQTLCSGVAGSGTTACNLTGGTINWKVDAPIGVGYKVRLNQKAESFADQSDGTFNIVSVPSTAPTSTSPPTPTAPSRSFGK